MMQILLFNNSDVLALLFLQEVTDLLDSEVEQVSSKEDMEPREDMVFQLL